MSALKYKLDRKTLENIYMSFIRPTVEYADIIWDNCGTYLSDRIDKIQIKAARIITGGIIRTSYRKLLEE